jgi:hypothetical protein
MEILKRLEPNISWSEDLECTSMGNNGQGCGSLLRISFNDLVFWPGVDGDSWGSRDSSVSFKCPVCKHCTDLPKEIWPRNLRELKKVTSSFYKRD